MNCAGIDYGVRRVAYSHPKKGVIEELILSTKQDDLECLTVMSAWVHDIVKRTRPGLVVIEQPIQGANRNVRTGISMGMVAGAFSVAVKQTDTKVVLIGPSTWKKAVIGHGYADKEAITDWLATNHPKYQRACDQLKKPQDGTDATCMAIYGNKVLAR